MKPAPFEYWRPETLGDALELLAGLGDDAKVLAGGQSLVPMMNLRLVRPAALVDLGGLSGLSGVGVASGTVEVGGLTRHLDLERNDVRGATGALLHDAASHIGHLPIRVRGTFGGSIAHADPASEWCVVVRTLDAGITLTGRAGSRTVAAADFFHGYFTTALQPDEVITAVTLPDLGDDYRVGFAEFARRAGDFAIVAATTVVGVQGGRIHDARVGVAGVADRPFRATDAEALMVDERPSEALFTEVASRAAAEADPPSDIQATADDRRDLVRALVRRALVTVGTWSS